MPVIVRRECLHLPRCPLDILDGGRSDLRLFCGFGSGDVHIVRLDRHGLILSVPACSLLEITPGVHILDMIVTHEMRTARFSDHPRAIFAVDDVPGLPLFVVCFHLCPPPVPSVCGEAGRPAVSAWRPTVLLDCRDVFFLCFSCLVRLHFRHSGTGFGFERVPLLGSLKSRLMPVWKILTAVLLDQGFRKCCIGIVCRHR